VKDTTLLELTPFITVKVAVRVKIIKLFIDVVV
jgi:hypothetical protein